MLNTSLHNKNARMGGPLTFEKFINSLNEAISRQCMPDSNTIKVDFITKIKRFILIRVFFRIFMIILKIMN
jgi:hypothetical protein